jgi:cell division protein FtsQ
MKRDSVLDHQLVKKNRQKGARRIKRTLGQLGFILIKMILFFLVLGGLSLALISGYQFLSTSPYFRLQNVVIAGVGDNVKHEVLTLSGLTARESLLSLDTVRIRKNIEKHAWIKSVSMKRRFPHTLCIDVENEEAIALVLLDRLRLMSKEGIIFKDVEKGDPVDLPVITGLSTDSSNNSEHLARVTSFLTTYSSMNVLLPVQQLSEVHVEKDGALSVYFNKLPFKVSFGRDDFVRKIDSLQHIVQHLQVTHLFHQTRSIDLDFSDRGIVAFKERVL